MKVAEAGERMPPGSGDQEAEERRAQGSRVAAVNAFSARLPSESRAGLGYSATDDAIEALATAVDEGSLRVPRLLVLDSLVRVAGRRGDQLRTHAAALDKLHEALVREAGVPENDVKEAVVTVRHALASAGRASGVTWKPHPWRAFAGEAADALRLTQAEIQKPLCNDREVVKKGDLDAVGVTVEFHTDSSPDELRRFCDPTRWHECSAYQHPMTPWKHKSAIDEKRSNGWRRDLVETVEFSPGNTLVTPLRFTHTIQDPDDPDWVHLDYVLLEKTDDILVDEGALDVRRVTSGEQQGRTRVSAKKAILFSNPLLAEWPTVACDTVWIDQVIGAAVGCREADARLG